MSVKDFHSEVANKERFEFGKNWAEFLAKLNDERIDQAEICLKQMLDVDNLEGKTFLDIGIFLIVKNISEMINLSIS